jgi:hypothetical protein
VLPHLLKFFMYNWPPIRCYITNAVEGALVYKPEIIMWHEDPMPGNDREKNYTKAVAR